MDLNYTSTSVTTGDQIFQCFFFGLYF